MSPNIGTSRNKADTERGFEGEGGHWTRPASVSAGLLVDGSDAPCQTMVYKLWVFHQHMEATRNAVAESFGLAGPQYTIFMAIARLEGDVGISSNALSELLQISPAFVAVEVKRLISLGLVVKSVEPKDRRKLRLQTTNNGRKAIQLNAHLICKANDLLFGGLTPDEFRQLVSLAVKLTSRSRRAAEILDAQRKNQRPLGVDGVTGAKFKKQPPQPDSCELIGVPGKSAR